MNNFIVGILIEAVVHSSQYFDNRLRFLRGCGVKGSWDGVWEMEGGWERDVVTTYRGLPCLHGGRGLSFDWTGVGGGRLIDDRYERKVRSWDLGFSNRLSSQVSVFWELKSWVQVAVRWVARIVRLEILLNKKASSDTLPRWSLLLYFASLSHKSNPNAQNDISSLEVVQ